MMKNLLASAAMALGLAACAAQQNPQTAAPAAEAAAPAGPVTVDAPAGVYKLEKTHASLHWRVSHMGLSNYTARFTKFDATLAFDPAKITESKLSVSIDPTSIETDYPGTDKDFDKELQSEQFFNAAKFPKITFTSTAITLTGANTGTVVGDLELLGVKKPVTLDVTFNGSKNPHPFAKVAALGFSGTAKFKRSDFGMNALLGGIGDEVEVLIEAEFLQDPAAK